MKYEQWMALVDKLVNDKTGLSVHDLADYNTRDWFDDGWTPTQACREILVGEGYLEEDEDEEDDFD